MAFGGRCLIRRGLLYCSLVIDFYSEVMMDTLIGPENFYIHTLKKKFD
jgi:hypothetical protein